METQELLASVDERSCLDFLANMVRYKSYSASLGELELTRYMDEQMRAIGLDSRLLPVPGDRLNAVGTLKGKGGAHSLLFNGHLDTDPVGEGWTVDPWAGKIDDQYIYGIGVSNMKAGDAAYFCALKTLIDEGVKLKGDAILTYVVGELQGGIGTVAAINQGIKADYFVNSEPTDVQALAMHAGSLIFIIELTGLTRHLSKREQAVDAIDAAVELIPLVNNLKFSSASSPEHEKINRAHIGVVHGALGKELQEWRPPQVADFVRLRGSARYASGQTVDQVLAELQKVLNDLCARRPGLKSVLMNDKKAGQPNMVPFEVAQDSLIIKAINASYKAVRGTAQPTGTILPPAFYGTDAGHLYGMLGMQGVVCGPGGKFNTMPDERVDIADYLDTIKIYMLTILQICNATVSYK